MKPRTRLLLLIAIAVVIVIILANPRLKILSSGPGDGTGTGARDTRLPVKAVIVRPEQLTNTIRATGTILANEEVELRSEIAGKIQEIVFQEGSRVRKGDLLVRINDDELRAQIKKLDSQKKLAEEKERRRRMLFEKQNISPEDYEIALNELNSIRAEIEYNRARLDKTALRAPFNGIIGLRYVSDGSYVSSTSRIATLQDVEKVKVDFAVPERYAAQVVTGQTIRFTRTGSDEVFLGRIFAVEPKIDPQTRTLQARALCANPGGRILPGAFVEVNLELERFEAALLVPSEAIIPELKGQKVFLYRGGRAEQSAVRTGLRTENKVQILEGVQPGDTVLTTGILQVAPGLSLNLTEVK